jgi:hypothetical protein
MAWAFRLRQSGPGAAEPPPNPEHLTVPESMQSPARGARNEVPA